jgi:hypothetical protein
MAISLASLKRGVDAKPPRIILVGSPGVGKTCFAGSAPGAVFVPTEDGLEPLIEKGLLPADLPRFRYGEKGEHHTAQSYQDVKESLWALCSEPHDHHWLVVDSADWLEPLIWKQVCEEYGVNSIEKVLDGFGKGYVEADKYWKEVIDAVNFLRLQRSMGIIFTAHTQIKKVDPPDGQPFDQYQMKLHKRAHALLFEWADIVGTAIPKTLVSTETRGSGKSAKKVSKAVGEMDRVIHFSEKPSVVAKNRYGLPNELPLSWAAFAEALAAPAVPRP